MVKILTLGESLVRFSTVTEERLRQLSQLRVVFGGAEANVASNLAFLGNSVKYATKVPDNELSQNIIYHLNGVKVNTESIIKDRNKGARLGTYFLEVGSDLRASSVIYDRANSSLASMTEKEWDLEALFEGVTHFHTTGITLGLSKFWNNYLVELIEYAKSKEIMVSFDMNYRAGLWSQSEAKEAFAKVLPLVDILSANRLDAKFFMDIDIETYSKIDAFLGQIAQQYPNVRSIFGTNRVSDTPNAYRLTGFYYDTTTQSIFYSNEYEIRYVVDRVGAGDAYAAGILDGIVNQREPQVLVDFATAASVLKHTVFGDANKFTSEQIIQFMNSRGGNIIR